MNTDWNQHLDESWVLKAIVDPNDLSDSQKAHLETCNECTSRVEQIEGSLEQFGHQSRESVPKYDGRFVLPAEHLKTGLNFHFIRPFYRIAIPALVAVIIVVAVFFPKPDHTTQVASVPPLVEDAEQLLSEIDLLIENPLPMGLQTMVSFTELDTDEDFMQYIVPNVEDDPLTNRSGKKGVRIC